MQNKITRKILILLTFFFFSTSSLMAEDGLPCSRMFTFHELEMAETRSIQYYCTHHKLADTLSCLREEPYFVNFSRIRFRKISSDKIELFLVRNKNDIFSAVHEIKDGKLSVTNYKNYELVNGFLYDENGNILEAFNKAGSYNLADSDEGIIIIPD